MKAPTGGTGGADPPLHASRHGGTAVWLYLMAASDRPPGGMPARTVAAMDAGIHTTGLELNVGSRREISRRLTMATKDGAHV